MLKNLALALLTPILLYLGWPEAGFAPLLFLAFVPLLLVEESISSSPDPQKGLRWFVYCVLAFAVWNLLNTHWTTVLAAVVINSILMSLVMLIFRFIKVKIGAKRGYIALPFLWISMESLHQQWDLAFPWLTLGNGFAANVKWVQWYEYLGSFGGSLWIWVINLILLGLIKTYLQTRKASPLFINLGSLIIFGIVLPILLSYYRYTNYEEKGEAAEVVVVQHSNIGESSSLSQEEQVEEFIRLAQRKLNPSIDFLLGPERLLTEGIDENRLSQNASINKLQNLAAEYDLAVVTGAMTFQHYQGKYTSTARPLKGEGYYDAHNSALFIDGTSPIETYHKSKLTPGVEKMPFHNWLSPYFGDIGTLGTQAERQVFSTANGKYKIAPLIGRESEFGEYLTEFVRKGANLLFIITNEDWRGESQAIQQMHHARLRAIENRKSIASAANTGISCFINQRGDIMERQPYGTEAVIRASLQANKELTYYSRAGDLLSRLSYFMAGFLTLYAVVYGYLRKKESLA